MHPRERHEADGHRTHDGAGGHPHARQDGDHGCTPANAMKPTAIGPTMVPVDIPRDGDHSCTPAKAMKPMAISPTMMNVSPNPRSPAGGLL